MPLTDRLRRFRPVGAPGGAAPVGVPVDAETGPAAELAPVFETLEPVVAECDRIRADGQRSAAETVAEAERQAAGLVADATSRAAAERADAATRIRRAGDAAGERLLAEARAEAARITEHGRRGVDEVVEALIGRLVAQITGPPSEPGAGNR